MQGRDPADAFAEHDHQAGTEFRALLEEGHEVAAVDDDHFAIIHGAGVRRAFLAIDQGNLAEQFAGVENVQHDLAAFRRQGADADMTRDNGHQTVAVISFLEQHLTGGKAVQPGKFQQMRQFFFAEML